ncbi:hypothetical protein B0H11DRAFT_2230114 [Mycena galericulata]|nr:hypothetical protein B0H11DRAFT_2230114 [Mycena galericulata]
MEKVPYIDRPLPMISTRQKWDLFAWRTLPVICARMSQEELAQLIGGDVPVENDDDGSAGMLTPNETASQGDLGSASGRPVNGESRHTEEGTESSQKSSPSAKDRMKPPGQPNRPGSGGYSLEKHLLQKCGWSPEEFLQVQNKVYSLAAEKLDVSICYNKQPRGIVKAICETVKKEHSIVRGFDKCWVTKDMLMVHLKNTSEKHRARQMKRKLMWATSVDST